MSFAGLSGVYGVASDPYKIAATRAIGRARAQYLSRGEPLLDARYHNFSILFTKNAEETWGQKQLCHER